MPTDLMIFSPPTDVPTPMTTEHSSMSHTGMIMFSTEDWPLQKATPRNRTPMNFWPSCAPCMKLMPAAPAICAQRKNVLDLRLSVLANRRVTILHTPQPAAKPRPRERTSP
ncbi:Uncharacterised protein [Collinsella intestinalis]|nr:Uncharacterised protein [Collinsella intestinalis]